MISPYGRLVRAFRQSEICASDGRATQSGGARATRAEYRQLAHQTVVYGNAVEDHTWDHRSLTGASTRASALTARQVLAVLDRAKWVIVSATGLRPQFVRPPYGDTSAAVQRLARVLGLIEVGWTVDSNDYTGISTRQLVDTVLQVRLGGVVIMHDAVPMANTLAAIPAIAAGLRARDLCAGQVVRRQRHPRLGARHVPRRAGGLVISALESTA